MISNYLSSIEGVSFFAIVGLILFFFLFVGLVIWTFKADKSYIIKMQNIPLDVNEQLEKFTGIENEKK